MKQLKQLTLSLPQPLQQTPGRLPWRMRRFTFCESKRLLSLLIIDMACSMPQQGGKSEQGPKAQKGSKPAQPKGKPDFEQAGALADWLKDAAAEMKKQGVNQKFTVSSYASLCSAAPFSLSITMSLSSCVDAVHHKTLLCDVTQALLILENFLLVLSQSLHSLLCRTASLGSW